VREEKGPTGFFEAVLIVSLFLFLDFIGLCPEAFRAGALFLSKSLRPLTLLACQFFLF
jgi:hypothetical protein